MEIQSTDPKFSIPQNGNTSDQDEADPPQHEEEWQYIVFQALHEKLEARLQGVRSLIALAHSVGLQLPPGFSGRDADAEQVGRRLDLQGSSLAQDFAKLVWLAEHLSCTLEEPRVSDSFVHTSSTGSATDIPNQ